MTASRELSPQECARLIEDGGVGRLALCTPAGPEIYPVNFTVDETAIIFRVSPHTRLGTLAWGVDVAFETDHLNWSTRQGWSVVAKGRADVIDNPIEVTGLKERGKEPSPWAKGIRPMYVRVQWRQITGRVVGDEWLGSSPPAQTWWI
jgi:nitroimidazol reductase NimA-like FMN-containing flavoprotein (pyridoxamine 5'-phosphate oxidase superfamily)